MLLKTLIALTGSLALSACSSQQTAKTIAKPSDLRSKLALVGLEMITEEEALIPAREAGRYVPVRVNSSFPRPALEPHPAGYLIVGVNRRPAADVDAISQALSQWRPGETLVLTVRRNPYLQGETDWWEADVQLRYPELLYPQLRHR